MTDNKYNYGREIIFELRACHAISAEVYMHWLEKIDKEEQLITPIVSTRTFENECEVCGACNCKNNDNCIKCNYQF